VADQHQTIITIKIHGVRQIPTNPELARSAHSGFQNARLLLQALAATRSADTGIQIASFGMLPANTSCMTVNQMRKRL